MTGNNSLSPRRSALTLHVHQLPKDVSDSIPNLFRRFRLSFDKMIFSGLKTVLTAPCLEIEDTLGLDIVNRYCRYPVTSTPKFELHERLPGSKNGKDRQVAVPVNERSSCPSGLCCISVSRLKLLRAICDFGKHRCEATTAY